jgi:hypothetical protein
MVGELSIPTTVGSAVGFFIAGGVVKAVGSAATDPPDERESVGDVTTIGKTVGTKD